MKARFTSIAELELKEAMEFYEAAQAGLGGEFLAEVETTTRLIETHHRLGSRFPLEPAAVVHIVFPTVCSTKSALLKS